MNDFMSFLYDQGPRMVAELVHEVSAILCMMDGGGCTRSSAVVPAPRSAWKSTSSFIHHRLSTTILRASRIQKAKGNCVVLPHLPRGDRSDHRLAGFETASENTASQDYVSTTYQQPGLTWGLPCSQVPTCTSLSRLVRRSATILPTGIVPPSPRTSLDP